MAYGLPPRSIPSFEAAAAAAAIGRLYGGIHYRLAVEEGTRLGQQIGALELQRVRTREGAERVAETR